MLEGLVSSKIRRALLEYLLSHPGDRVYLRGLAKTLQVSISPLRRELKRLERAGMLKAIPEGNMVFYLIDPVSPAYLQLKTLGAPAGEPAPVAAIPMRLEPTLAPQPARRVNRLAPFFAGAGIVAMAIGLSTAITNHHALTLSRALSARKPDVTVVVQPPASGAMRGAKWQIVPGGVGGGFGSATNSEAY